jgi:hypothetical protein
MFLLNFHIFINKRAMLRQKFTVQVTTLPDCDDITRFDGTRVPLPIDFRRGFAYNYATYQYNTFFTVV